MRQARGPAHRRDGSRDGRRLTVLVTGFGPFPGAPHNPTGAIVAALLRRRRPAFSSLDLAGHVFRTSYAAVDAELPALIARHRPDVLLMFGLAARTPHIRIETRARNHRSLLFPDIAGRLPQNVAIEAGAASKMTGRAPFERLRVAANRARAPARLSVDAGRYLCNYIYRRALQLPPADAPCLVSFIHVPKVRRVPRPRSRVKHRAVTHCDLARAGEAILLALAAAARRPVVPFRHTRLA